MAINDESFYNILGEEVTRSAIVQKMIDYYFMKLEFGETKITDFNEGSEIRNLLESIAVDIYDLLEDNYEVSRIAFIPTAYGEWLDRHGENPLMQIERNQGSEAVGTVTFSIPNIMSTNLIIPEGTIIVSEENNLEYETNNEAVIVAGTTSADSFVTCLTVGSDGNSSANTLKIIDDANIDNSVSVTNTEAIIGGVDYEDDDSYRERLLNYNKRDDFGSVGYYENLGAGIEGVHDILLDTTELDPITIIVNGDVKPVNDEVLIAVLTEFTDTNNIVLGHNFTVEGVEYTEIGSGFVVNVNTKQQIDNTDIKDLLNAIFNGGTSSNNFEYGGLNIGETLSYNSLVSAFENNFDYVTNVSFTYNGTSFSVLEPATTTKVLNIDVDDITINQTIEE